MAKRYVEIGSDGKFPLMLVGVLSLIDDAAVAEPQIYNRSLYDMGH